MARVKEASAPVWVMVSVRLLPSARRSSTSPDAGVKSVIVSVEAAATECYAHLAADPMREAANIVGTRLEAALEGRKAEVIEINRKPSK